MRLLVSLLDSRRREGGVPFPPGLHDEGVALLGRERLVRLGEVLEVLALGGDAGRSLRPRAEGGEGLLRLLSLGRDVGLELGVSCNRAAVCLKGGWRKGLCWLMLGEEDEARRGRQDASKTSLLPELPLEMEQCKSILIATTKS